MKDAIRFVSGSVSTSDLVPGHRSILFRGGRVYATNGVTYASAPCDTDIDGALDGRTLTKIIKQFGDNCVLKKLKDQNTVIATDGNTAVYIPKGSPVDAIEPQRETVCVSTVKEYHLDRLALALRFASSSSTTCMDSVCIHEGHALATNAASIVRVALGREAKQVHNAVIPAFGVQEVLRNRKSGVTRLTVTDQHATFTFSNDAWIRIELYPIKYPSFADMVKTKKLEFNNLPELPSRFFAKLKTLMPYTNEYGHVFFANGRASTSSSKKRGAVTRIKGVSGAFDIKLLMLMEGVATHADLACYPDISPFRGPGIRGVIAPLHQPESTQ